MLSGIFSLLNRSNFKVLLVLAAVFVSACSEQSAPKKQDESRIAPDFSLQSLDGKQYTLSGLRGRVVFVNFWATWCPPCREEIPSMVKFYNKMKNEGVEILAVSEDTDIEAVRKFVKKYQITFPILMDTKKEAYRLYRATGVPETHLIGKDGAVDSSQIGPFDWTMPDVENSVRRLLAAQ